MNATKAFADLFVLLVLCTLLGSHSLSPTRVLSHDLVAQVQVPSPKEETCEVATAELNGATLPCDVWTDGHTRYCKPAFLFLGCQKCGSSSFWKAMMEHPNVTYSGRKEILFWKKSSAPFSRKTHHWKENREQVSIDRACDYYSNFKDIPVRGDGADIHAITGEFSATYFECVGCPWLFKQILPSAKMMVMLREPWSRALSRYNEQVIKYNDYNEENLHRHRHRSSIGYPSWVEFTSHFDRLVDCLADAQNVTTLAAECASKDNVFGWSMYAILLQNWIDAGYSKTDFLILYLDAFESDAAAQMHKVERFLNLPFHVYSDEIKDKYNSMGNYGWTNKAALLQNSSNESIKQFYAYSVKDLRNLCEAKGWQQPPESWDQVV